MNEELFLVNKTGRRLFHKYAEHLPIIDYHCHLPPQAIAENKVFADLGEIWLSGDHYKWRAMRTFGIDEQYITGSASYKEKFLAFAKIMPRLAGNPLYIWCALELKRYFGIDEPLGPGNAESIYGQTKRIIEKNLMTPRYCMEKSKVKLVCTTEYPTDTLEYHKKIGADTSMKVKVHSAFRPDQAMFCEKQGYAAYILELSKCAGVSITGFAALIDALEMRLKYFNSVTGTTVSDDGVPYFHWADYTGTDVEAVFKKALNGERLSQNEINQFRSAFLFEMGRRYHRSGFVMQLHIGTLVDANTARFNALGQSVGVDCVDDSTQSKSVAALLDKLTLAGELPKTILYPLNLHSIESFAIIASGFCDCGTKAKVQIGAPWWFNDQVYGIDLQFRSVANLYPLSLSVGMLTDSRSFLSYPRHELYRRVLCNYLGSLVESGEYFSGEAELASIIEDVSYNNTNEFFGFNV